MSATLVDARLGVGRIGASEVEWFIYIELELEP